MLQMKTSELHLHIAFSSTFHVAHKVLLYNLISTLKLTFYMLVISCKNYKNILFINVFIIILKDYTDAMGKNSAETFIDSFGF